MKRALLPALLSFACCRSPGGTDAPEPPPSAVEVTGSGSARALPPTPTPSPTHSALAPSPPASSSGPSPLPLPDGRPLHLETQEDLLALMPIRTYSDKEIKRKGDPMEFLKKNVGPDSPARMNQGNKAISTHMISREKCLEGLRGVVLQTEEQHAICGADYMVPVYKKGDIKKTKHCIDIFEFPNRPCELPYVWVGPTQAAIYCEMEGKRLCTQEEWVTACKGDPEGKEDWLYSYGNDLDLTACNTNKPARTYGEPICDPDSVSSTWKTCHSNTEPAGSFPRCRSRFGVFDMQGNVAEEMVRFDPEENALVSQLKGSAFFYVDVARKHNEPQAKGGRETYPDHCAHDPRWHVERMSLAWHVNYHLGFRCCKNAKVKE